MDRSIDTRDSRERSRERPSQPGERGADIDSTLRSKIDAAMHGGSTFSEFVQRLKDRGVTVIPSVQQSGRLNGFSFGMNGERVRGSDLGRRYTAQNLQKAGILYDASRDAALARALSLEGERTFPRPERTVETKRTRDRFLDIDPLLRVAMKEIGRFRTILHEDFARIHYAGDRARCHQELRELRKKGFVEERSVVITTHSKNDLPVTKSVDVLVLTKKGKDLFKSDPHLRATNEMLYSGFVKPREIAHDTAIYRMYQAEAAHIREQGGHVKRIVLDYELKKKAYSPLAKARAISMDEFKRKQEAVARELGLHVVGGKMRLPDLRIEYETATGDAARVDLELATEHYRGDHMTAKSGAGFKIYAEHTSFPPGGSYGKSPVFDDHHIEVFSF